MFCLKTSLKKMDKIHERSLRLVLDDYSSDFNDLLTLSNMSIHQRCINFLMTEVFKYLNGLSPDLMNDVFVLTKNTYNLRNFNIFKTENPRSTRFGLDAIAHRASELWQSIPNDIKESPSLALFKDKIKTWRCKNCPCNLFKTFIPGLGYVK